MKLKVAMNVLAGTILIVAFQNCSKTNFASNSGDGTLQSLSGSGSKDGGMDQDGDLCTVNDDSFAQSQHASASCHNMKVPDDGGGDNGQERNACDKDASNKYVACIINARGKSSKLGLISGALQETNSASQSVCVTKAECLGDISQAFNVQGSYDRGYCDRNPFVQRLSDAKVKQLLGI